MIDCFYFAHDRPPIEEAHARQLLNDEERGRADRFLHPQPRKEFTLTRGVLRKMLGERIGAVPRDLVFQQNAAGKPFLEGDKLPFNVSHSHGLSLIGISSKVPLGVDVEPVRDLASRESLARRWFHPGEVAYLEKANWDAEAFFAVWTAKEAVVKALGTGLGFGMDEVWIDFETGLPPVLRQLGKSLELPRDWSLVSQKLGPNHWSSVAYQGPKQAIVWTELGNHSESLK